MAKRLRSIPPDVTVVVGTVPNAQSFSVYKLALCFASPYFDTMLSSGMREDNTNSIELPDKDPEEWKAFYSIIDPSQIGQVQSESSIDEDNAVMLTKWFHEFQMDKHLKECDDVLANKVEELSHWDEKSRGRLSLAFWELATVRRREHFSELMNLLEHSCKFDLTKTIHEVERTVGSLLKSHLNHCQVLFDSTILNRLVQLCLPITSTNMRLVSTGPCKNLWTKHLYNFLSPQRANITDDMVNNNEMFPLLLHSLVQLFALKQAKPLSGVRVRRRGRMHMVQRNEPRAAPIQHYNSDASSAYSSGSSDEGWGLHGARRRRLVGVLPGSDSSSSSSSNNSSEGESRAGGDILRVADSSSNSDSSSEMFSSDHSDVAELLDNS